MSMGWIARTGRPLVWLVVLATVTGCIQSRTPSPAVPARSESATPSPAINGSPVPGSPAVSPSADDRPLFAEDDGLSLSVILDRDVIPPGGTVIVSTIIRNDRPRDVIVGGGWCGATADVTARLRIPTEPMGRAWAGIKGAWKEFALAGGLAPGGGPADEDVTIHGSTGPGCDPSERTLSPGEVVTVDSRLTAEIVDGVPALPGDVPLEISVLHDPVEPAPALGPPRSAPPLHGGLRIGPSMSQLIVRATIRVAGDAPHILSLGEAVDGMLVDRRFATWLAAMPARTWSVSNLFLQNNGRAEGIVPAGPSWEIDLFREIGVPRNWAIGFVDPFGGEVLNLAFCDVPCDR